MSYFREACREVLKSPSNWKNVADIEYIKIQLLQNRPGGGEGYTINKMTPPSSSGGSSLPPRLLGSLCPLPEERCLSMPEIGEKERNYSFKIYTDLE